MQRWISVSKVEGAVDGWRVGWVFKGLYSGVEALVDTVSGMRVLLQTCLLSCDKRAARGRNDDSSELLSFT